MKKIGNNLQMPLTSIQRRTMQVIQKANGFGGATETFRKILRDRPEYKAIQEAKND